MVCPCGSAKAYSDCCEALHDGLKQARTAEELMRSRYSAFAVGNAEYLYKTSLPIHHAPNELEMLRMQMNSVEWLRLDVVFASEESVEFKAYYRDADGIQLLHEKSTFVHENGQWFYDEGTLYTAKIERNEPCPCGSGKKYKKCCG